MIDIVYEDQDVIVVIKPVGMPCQKDPSGEEDLYTTVQTYLLDQGAGIQLGLHQRLDRPVGGLVLMSKSPAAAKGLNDQMQEKQIDKWYLALVDGKPLPSKELCHYIQKVRGNRSVVSNKKVANGKKAILNYKRLFEHDGHWLLEVKLETGRHHQIRAQLGQVGLPLIGDTKYNPTYGQLKGWHEIGLYAYKVGFCHPVTHKDLVFEQWPQHGPFQGLEKAHNA